jgi:serine/threonine protein kinase
MSDTSKRPVTSAPPGADKASETNSSALDATGPQPAPVEPPTVPDGRDPPAQRLLGGFAIVDKIGEGGMGAVYLAEDVKLRRKVAIKMMRPELAANRTDRERFEREARAVAAVEHDNIVPILHIDEGPDGAPFIVMPLLQGETLDARLKRESVVPLDLILQVAGEVAAGLAAAHAAGLIHRDIKPTNIWLEGDRSARDLARQVRRCKILDFGLARWVDGGDIQLTSTGAIMGTPAYMSPEQAQSKKADHRADLFSLGAALYRAATGNLPFDGPTPMAVMIALSTESPLPLRAFNPNLPPALAELIDRLMCKDPAERPQSAEEVVDVVRRIALDARARGAGHTLPVRVVPLASVPAAAELSPSVPQVLPSAVDEQTDSDAPAAGEPRPEERPRLRWLPWLIAAVGVLALIPFVWWMASAMRTQQRDPDTVKNPEPPKSTAPAKGPKQKEPKIDTPKTAPKNPEPVKDPDPAKNETNFEAERRAALFVLSVGGMLRVEDDVRDITDPGDLPKGHFRLTHVRKNSDERINNTSLAVFKDCKHLERIDFGDTRMGDVGLSYFGGCKDLESLDIGSTRVSDAGLETIKQFKKLTYLDVGLTQVTRQGREDLAKVLPRCEIRWESGRIKPKE